MSLQSKNRAMVVAVDFDGVLADYKKGWQGEDVFGEPVPGAAEALRWMKHQGCRIIIWTSRKDTPALRRYLRSNRMLFDFVNRNGSLGAEYQVSPKVFAHVFIDDRSVDRMQQFDRTAWVEVARKIKGLIATGKWRL